MEQRARTWDRLVAQERRDEAQKWKLQERARRGDWRAAQALVAGWPELFAPRPARDSIMREVLVRLLAERVSPGPMAAAPADPPRPHVVRPRGRPSGLTDARYLADVAKHPGPGQSHQQRAQRLDVSRDAVRYRARKLRPSALVERVVQAGATLPG
jgi:hypothetical protein